MKQLLAGILILLVAASCGTGLRRPAPRDVRPEPVVPLYTYFAEADSDAILALPRIVGEFMHAVNYPDTLPAIQAWCHSLPVKVFTPAVDSLYGTDGGPVGQYLGYALAAARLEDIEFPSRSYVAVVYGRREAVGFTDSTMFIALNHFLGDEYEGYRNFPAYERLEKTPAQLPYAIAEALCGWQYPYQAPAEGETALSRMLYNGALALARLYLVKNSTPAAALGYSEEQYRWLLDNEQQLWKELVAQNLLYDTAPSTWQKLVAPAPSTPILNIYSPGRAGRFIGFRMVESYVVKNPETSLADLFSPDFYTAPDILQRIGYRP